MIFMYEKISKSVYYRLHVRVSKLMGHCLRRSVLTTLVDNDRRVGCTD